VPTTTQGDGILDLVEMEQLELDMIDGVQKRLLATGNHEAELIRLASFRDEVVAGDHVETLMAFKRDFDNNGDGKVHRSEFVGKGGAVIAKIHAHVLEESDATLDRAEEVGRAALM
jgi:hypothetical protein